VLFDRKVRYAGDRVALVAAETHAIALDAMQAIKVTYKELPPLFEPGKAMSDGAPILHDDDQHAAIPVPYRPDVNLAAELEIAFGDLDQGFAEADFVEEHSYSTQYASHCAIEPHAALAYFDERGRVVVVSTTQVPFHTRRIVTRVLGLPKGMVRVIKPRIGGGFGGKQEVILEPLVALVAWRNKRPARLVMSRKEVFISTRTRHPQRIRFKMGAKDDGRITALDMEALMNTGAYGTHALTVLSNTGSKVLPLFNKVENLRFLGKSVYTNLPVGGAYRGYGATQGYFGFNQQIDMIARRVGEDVVDFCKKWHIREGETSGVFEVLGEGKEGVGQVISSCRLDECLDRGAAAIDWQAKRDKRTEVSRDVIRGVGLAIAMQGSGIPQIDMGSATMKMNEDGTFGLFVGATDIGTGSDTILAQIAAEVLSIPVGDIMVLSSDTDLTPFDVGAYASSTTFISGEAVRKCAEKIKSQILMVAAEMLSADSDSLLLGNSEIVEPASGRKKSYQEIAYYSLYARNQFQIQADASHVSSESPPPFIAQFAEVGVDVRTGRVHIVKFVSAVDCGQPINPRLAEGQVEGAVVNGISYALWEDYRFSARGVMRNPSFGSYKIFTAADIPAIETYLVDSYEESGPFGAKSVGEISPTPSSTPSASGCTKRPSSPKGYFKRSGKAAGDGRGSADSERPGGPS
jgi:CO/xanthine dehydrogenase Mo-binding subunit